MDIKDKLFFHPSYIEGVSERRIFLFAHAGAGASFYMRWKKFFDRKTAVYPIQLPGHENRSSEALEKDFYKLTDRIADIISDYTDMPYAFFGHSLGASVCFDTAVKLQKKGMNMPQSIFLSANRPPVIKPDYSFIYSIDDDEFCSILCKNGAFHGDMLSDKEFRAAFLPVIRADFELYASYDASQERYSVDSDIYALCGDNDPFASKEHMLLWKGYTKGSFSLVQYSGAHFYINDNIKDICGRISSSITKDTKAQEDAVGELTK